MKNLNLLKFFCLTALCFILCAVLVTGIYAINQGLVWLGVCFLTFGTISVAFLTVIFILLMVQTKSILQKVEGDELPQKRAASFPYRYREYMRETNCAVCKKKKQTIEVIRYDDNGKHFDYVCSDCFDQETMTPSWLSEKH